MLSADTKMQARMELIFRMQDVLGAMGFVYVASNEHQWRDIIRSFMAGKLIKVRMISADDGDFDIEII